jgi:hypothetical protein
MQLQKNINRLTELQKEYSGTADNQIKRAIKKEAVKLYFDIEEDLYKIKYNFRIIDIRNFKEKEITELKTLNLFSDFLSVDSLPRLPHVKQNALPIPLLLFLFYHYGKQMSALTSSAVLMDTVKKNLREGDFQHLQSGSLRFITNVRFASDKLRQHGLLRKTEKEKYHYWELTLFGILISALIFDDSSFTFKKSHFPSNYADEHSLDFFYEKLNYYIDKLLIKNGFDNIVHNLFREKPILYFLNGIKTPFIIFLEELKWILNSPKKNNNDLINFFERFNTYLSSIDEEQQALNLAHHLLLSISTKEKYLTLMEEAFYIH